MAAPAAAALNPARLRFYGKRPGKAAARLAWLRQHAAEARQRGDEFEADQLSAEADEVEAVLAQLGRCRICGRTLTDPVSVRLGIGPDCRRGSGVE